MKRLARLGQPLLFATSFVLWLILIANMLPFGQQLAWLHGLALYAAIGVALMWVGGPAAFVLIGFFVTPLAVVWEGSAEWPRPLRLLVGLALGLLATGAYVFALGPHFHET